MDKKNLGRFEVINHPEMFDGVRVKKGQAVAVIRSNARTILACERVILNLMQRMSGISTLPGSMWMRWPAPKRKCSTRVRRLRAFACWTSMLCVAAGARAIGLIFLTEFWSRAIILLWVAAFPRSSPAHLRDERLARRLQCEVRTLTELEQALTAGAESLLLDNMSPAETKKAVGIVRGTRSYDSTGSFGWDHAREYS